jgi:hypothetical protein
MLKALSGFFEEANSRFRGHAATALASKFSSISSVNLSSENRQTLTPACHPGTP